MISLRRCMREQLLSNQINLPKNLISYANTTETMCAYKPEENKSYWHALPGEGRGARGQNGKELALLKALSVYVNFRTWTE